MSSSVCYSLQINSIINVILIIVKSCFVTTLQRAKRLAEGKVPGILPPGFKYRVDGDTVIEVESTDREFPFETLFEQDNDQISLSTMILDSILKVNLTSYL